MDPITTAIIAALSAGTIGGLTDTTKAAITDGYNKLKGMLTKKFGASSDIVQALNKLEAKPDSQDCKETLQKEIIAVKAEQDDEILATAKQVLTLVKSQQAGMGKIIIQNNGPVQGLVVENHGPITINFRELPQDG